MKRLIEAMQFTKYRVTIPGLTNRVGPKLQYALAENEEDAIYDVVRSIAKASESPHTSVSKDMTFKVSNSIIKVTPRNAALIAAYVYTDKDYYKVEKLL